MYNILHKLISARFYVTAETAAQKIDVLYVCNKLSDQEYADLTALTAQMYPAQETPPQEFPESDPA